MFFISNLADIFYVFLNHQKKLLEIYFLDFFFSVLEKPSTFLQTEFIGIFQRSKCSSSQWQIISIIHHKCFYFFILPLKRKLEKKLPF